jgi:taurine dioxygenase
MSYETITAAPLAGHVGAEIRGIDIAAGITGAQAKEILDAHARYGVLVFRDQFFSPEAHLALAEKLGVININRFFNPVDDYPRIAEVLKEPDQQLNIGSDWHTDHSYDREPAMGSLLYARELPARGGDTLFASTAAAYESLSPGLKKMLGSMNAVHSSRLTFGPQGDTYDTRIGNSELAQQDNVHPVIIAHPVTRRPCIYVNTQFTMHFEHWTREESAPLVDYLVSHISQSAYTCRVRWLPGTLVFWDNRGTWHRALNDYHGHRRLMHRITLEGTPLAAA